MNIGQRIRDLRKEKNLSGKELAGKIGVTQGFLSGLENGTKKCSLENLQSICNALNITLAEFFTDEEIYNEAADKYIQDLIAYYDKNPETKIAADKLRAMSKAEQRALAKKHVKAGRVAESGIEYELFSVEETIEIYKSLPVETQEALAKVIRLFASNHP